MGSRLLGVGGLVGLALVGCAAPGAARPVVDGASPSDGDPLADAALDLPPPDLASSPDLASPVPPLIALTPADLTIASGASFALTAMFGGRLLGPQPFDVTFTSSDPQVVVVPKDAQLVFNTDRVTVRAAAARLGDAVVTAQRGAETKTATIHVVPSLAMITPAMARVPRGKSATFTVTLSGPARKGGAVLQLASADPKIFTLPVTKVTVAEGMTQVSFAVDAVGQGGPVALSAGYASSLQVASGYAIDPVDRLALSEVLYDALGADEGWEWIELWNGGKTPIDLTQYFLAATASSMDINYRAMTTALAGTLMPGDCKLVGGPMADPMANGLAPNFAFHQAVQFNPSLPNGTALGVADTSVGAALMKGDPNQLANATLVDVVIYGKASRGIKDEAGGTMRVDVGYVPFPKQTLERVGPASWRIQDKPSGGSCDWLRL